MKNLIGLALAATVIFTAAFACSMGTANLSSFKLSKDQAGTQETTNFKGGDTIYGRAPVANNGGKVKVKMQINVDDVAGMNKGDMVKGSDVTIDIDGDETATYSMPIPVGVKPGKYIATADMINDAGEKKDSKSVNFSVEAGTPPVTTNKKSDDDDDDDK